MKHSAKTAPPAAFSNWLALANDGWQPSYSTLSGAPRAALFAKLLQEQGVVCAYCGRRISIDETNAHIDHFWPQSDFGETSADNRSLDYENLFVSCGPNLFPEGHAKRFPVTCGDAKGNKYDIKYFILPSDPQCEHNFKFGTLGSITPNPPSNQSAAKMIEMLNLSDPTLQYDRSVLLQGIEKQIIDGEISVSNKGEFIQIWKSRDDNQKLKYLSHAVIRYIEEEVS